MLAALLGAAPSLQAEDTGGNADANEEIPNVISYGQRESLPDNGLQTLLAEQFAIGGNSISDVLQQMNGLQLQPLGGLGDPVLVSMRGASSQQTRLLIDGIEVTQSQFGSYDLNALPLHRIARIEILNAGADMSNGLTADQAIGGTINLVTDHQPDSPDTHVRAALGAWGTASASIDTRVWAARDESGRIRSHTHLWYEHQRSDNNYEYPVSSPEDAPTERNRLEPLRNSEYRRDSLTLTQATPWARGSLNWQSERKNLPYFHRNPKQNDAALDSDILRLQLSGNPALTTGNRPLTLHWQLFHQRHNDTFKDPQGVIGLGVDDDRYQYRHSQFNFGIVTRLNAAWTFGSGIQLAHQTYHSEYRNDADSEQCTNPLGNCDSFSWLDQLQWLTQANWRNDDDTRHFHISAQHNREQRGQRARKSQRQKDVTSWTYPSVQISWQQSHWIAESDWLWRVSYKRNSRSPTLYEQFGDHGLLVGSPNLEPELGRTWSLDNELDTEWFQLPTRLSLNLFQRQLEKAIVPVYSSTGVGRYVNTHSATLTGLEWQWQQNLPLSSSHWQWSLAGSHYQSKTDDPTNKSFDGKHLAGIYHIRLIANLDWHIVGRNHNEADTGEHHLNLSAELADDLYTGPANLPAERADQRRLVNAAYRYTWEDGNTGLRINNLMNNRFNDYSQRPARTRYWTLFLQYQF
ncbi:MAG: hypothetical protein CMI09_04840 [Oceanospirillaceae bacterium]|nr:hypothetical protein [Oceanospirillaceae bacterium]